MRPGPKTLNPQLCPAAQLENTLLDGSPKPLVKITDFGYCKSDKESLPKSKVGTPGYTGARRAASLLAAAARSLGWQPHAAVRPCRLFGCQGVGVQGVPARASAGLAQMRAAMTGCRSQEKPRKSPSERHGPGT